MGTDIEMVVERRTASSWEFVPDVMFTDRNYDIFGLLGGRGRLARAVPEQPMLDVASATWAALYGCLEGHNVVTLGQLQSLDLTQVRKIPLNWFSFLESLAKLGPPEEVRVVYAFL